MPQEGHTARCTRVLRRAVFVLGGGLVGMVLATAVAQADDAEPAAAPASGSAMALVTPESGPTEHDAGKSESSGIPAAPEPQRSDPAPEPTSEPTSEPTMGPSEGAQSSTTEYHTSEPTGTASVAGSSADLGGGGDVLDPVGETLDPLLGDVVDGVDELAGDLVGGLEATVEPLLDAVLYPDVDGLPTDEVVDAVDPDLTILEPDVAGDPEAPEPPSRPRTYDDQPGPAVDGAGAAATDDTRQQPTPATAVIDGPRRADDVRLAGEPRSDRGESGAAAAASVAGTDPASDDDSPRDTGSTDDSGHGSRDLSAPSTSTHSGDRSPASGVILAAVAPLASTALLIRRRRGGPAALHDRPHRADVRPG